jgi:flagellin
MYLLFNASAATALQSLTSAQNQLAAAQTQLSTGQTINNASDNIALWCQATTMQSDAGAWGVIAAENGANSTGAPSPALTSATTSLTNVASVLNQMKAAITTAQSAGSNPTSTLATLQQDGQQLKSIVSSSAFQGSNLLDNSTTTNGYTIPDSYNSVGLVQGAHLATVSLVDAGTGTSGILQAAQATGSTSATDFTSLTASDLSAANIGQTLSNIDKAISQVTGYSATIGGMQPQLSAMGQFASMMQTNLNNAAASLTGANMNEVSTRLSALQTQVQLATQSLSIANQSSALLLKLFQ